MMQEAVTALIDEQFDREVDFLQRMVQSRSTNHFTPEVSTPDVPVEQQVAGVILEQLQQLGFPASLQGVSSQRPNVMCSVPGTDPGGKSLIVTTHMDTVEPSKGYTRDPFGAEVEGGRLFGVGVADAKAQIAACIYAAYALRRAGIKLKGNLSLAFVVDEESGACSQFGTQYLLEQGLLRGNAALVGEPGHDKIALGHRGLYRFRVQTKGEAIHTGLKAWEEKTRGHNAASDMAHLIVTLEQCLLPFTPSPTFPGRKPVLTFPTLLQAGDSVNMVPGQCVAYGDVRLLPGLGSEELRQIIRSFLDQAHVPYQFEPVVYVPAVEIAESTDIVQTLSAAVEAVTGKRVRCAGAGPACDGWMFISRGIPAVCGYGVECGGVHGADEWVDIESLRQVTKVYALTILNFLGIA